MKSLLRAVVTAGLLVSLLAGPATTAGADTLASADVGPAISEVVEGLEAQAGSNIIEVEDSECPYGYSGVVLDFYVGNPPRHVFTLRACQNIVP
ncbi:MAG: hypothetical protein M3271_04905 [Actinomycetota bacterium]|nr:hypothetical protein [Actinomycetota bacterium]